MGGLLLISLLAAVSTAVNGQVASAHVGTSGGSSNFQGQGAALSENVGPDGSRQGECAYADSNGQQIQVRFSQQQGREAQYQLVKGGPGTNPAAAYEQCLQQYRASQQAGAAFIPDFNAFNPFAGGAFDFGGLANAAQAFAGGFGGVGDPGFQQAAGGGLRHAHDQLQQNVLEMQQRNAELHNRLAGRFGRGAL